MSRDNEKIFIGPKLRKLRKDAGLNQTELAGRLGISPTYVNLMEGNARPVSAKVLIGLSQVFGIDITELTTAKDGDLLNGVRHALRDPAMSEHGLDANLIEQFVGGHPEAANAFVDLHQRYRALMDRVYSDANPLSEREKVDMLQDKTEPIEMVRAYLHRQKNYFPALEEVASQDYASFTRSGRPIGEAIRERLATQHKLTIRVLPHEKMANSFGFFDYHKAGVDLSELLTPSAQRFRLAYHCVQLEHGKLIEAQVNAANFHEDVAKQLVRNSLTNYLAGALLMPYDLFFEAAESTRYDIELLGYRFNTSFEQTAHRLTTLQKSGAKGVPFYFVRVDSAGNISKRFSGGDFFLSKFGGSCSLWHAHQAFQYPDETLVQAIEMPDQAQFISIAKAVRRSQGFAGRTPVRAVICLGCDVKYAERIVYADELVLETPEKIGLNCYLCDRQNCEARAYPPLNKKLHFSGFRRGMSVFQFDRE